jgi:hypothetical protein
MEKVVGEEIKEGKQKEKKDKRTKWVTKLGFAIDWTTLKCAKKCVQKEFISTWILVVVM